MNCEQTRSHLAGRSLNALDEESAAQVDDHLSGCAACRHELEQLRSTLEALESWSASEPPPQLAAQTMAALRNEMRLPWWRRWLMQMDEALGRFASHQPRPATTLATLGVAVLLLIPVLSPHFSRGRSSGSVVGCRGNLRLLSKALEEYAKAHQGRYPERLEELQQPQGPVRIFPDCPSAGHETYRSGYQVSSDRMHFTLSCSGLRHADAGLPANQPEVHR